MEHLMTEKDAQFYKPRILQIPWLSFDHDIEEQQVVDFADYLLHRGWTKDQIRALKNGDTLAYDGTSCLAMLQSWLVFGFLEGIFKRRFPSSRYVVDTASGRVVDTAQLRHFFDR